MVLKNYNILLLHSSEFNTTGKKIETQYIFLDDRLSEDGYSIHTIHINDEDMKIVEGQIQDFWSYVNSGNLIEGCNGKDCDFCRLGSLVNFNLLNENVENRK